MPVGRCRRRPRFPVVQVLDVAPSAQTTAAGEPEAVVRVTGGSLNRLMGLAGRVAGAGSLANLSPTPC